MRDASTVPLLVSYTRLLHSTELHMNLLAVTTRPATATPCCTGAMRTLAFPTNTVPWTVMPYSGSITSA